MALTITELAQVLEEIRPVLQCGWIQKIHQPTPHALVLEIRTPGRTHRLLISCRPDTARMHLVSRSIPNPPMPPAFCQFLRAHLPGARIDTVEQRPNDRIVDLHVTAKEGQRTLVCELTGKTANILVLNEAGIVLRDLNRHTTIVGHPYKPPPPSRAVPQASQMSRLALVSAEPFPVSHAIERYYSDKETELGVDAAQTARLTTLKKLVKKEQKRVDAWQHDLARAGKYRGYDRYGELLKANLGSIKKGMDRIILVDYYDETMPEITIPLDGTKSGQGNMDDYFRKHRKYLAAERELKPRIEQAVKQLDVLRRELAAIEQGLWTPPAPSTLSAVRNTAAPRQERHRESRGPFRRFTSADGLPIFVGRNARENDELTFGLAKSDDLWLHARGTPGSHVVVRLEKGADPPLETLRDAATLALLYSDLKKNGKGDVIYTRRKWVKKAKGQASGAVIVTQEQSLHVALDRTRLEAIKQRSTRESGAPPVTAG